MFRFWWIICAMVCFHKAVTLTNCLLSTPPPPVRPVSVKIHLPNIVSGVSTCRQIFPCCYLFKKVKTSFSGWPIKKKNSLQSQEHMHIYYLAFLTCNFPAFQHHSGLSCISFCRWQTLIGAALLVLFGKLGWVEMSRISRYHVRRKSSLLIIILQSKQ